MIAQLTDFSARMLVIEQASHVVPWTEKTLASCFGDDYQVYGWFSDADNTLQGFYIAHHVADELTLMNIAVHCGYQGRGIGRQLMQHLIALARQQNATIWLEVRVSNAVAQALYLSLGFTEVGRRPNYYPLGDGREDAMVMRWSPIM